MDMILGMSYLIIGAVSTFWLEQLFVDQGYGDNLGLAFEFGDRLESIIFWPVFTLPVLLKSVVAYVKFLCTNGQQQA